MACGGWFRARRAHLCGCLALALHLLPGQAQLQCGDDAMPPPALSPAAARAGWQALVQTAAERSQALGAARLLAAAAAQDLRETAAASQTQASLGAGLGPSISQVDGSTSTSALQGNLSVGVSRLLYDGGRQQRLVDWRAQLAEAARLGQVTQQEQLALSAVSLALDLERYRLHEQVYGQHVAKMACLVQALRTVVAADRGRASELLQARKAMQQAELAQVQAQSQRRQAEIRLDRLLGPGQAQRTAAARLLDRLPPLGQVLADAEQSAELAQLDRQADAAGALALAADAATRPQLSWSVTGSRSLTAGGNAGSRLGGGLAVGLQLSLPLLQPGSDAAVQAARLRERAVRAQRDDAREGRHTRVRETWEQAQASFDRVDRIATVLADSERVRQSTLLQWQQLGRRSLFDVMAAESEHYGLRIAKVNTELDAQQLGALLWSLGLGLERWLTQAP